MGSFQQGTIDLAEKVGRGKLTGTIVVDQVYAASQHSGYWVTGPLAGHVIRNHPRGGQSHYLEEPLFAQAEHYMKNLADAVLDGFLVQAMAENMEDLASEVFDKAPRLDDILRNSANPRVSDDGKEAYNRPPLWHRLSKAELKELRRGDR